MRLKNFQIIAGIILFLILGCDSNIFDLPKEPVIESLESSRFIVDPGDTVHFSVSAKNPNKGTLQYEWLANGGQFLPPFDQPEIDWKSPVVGGLFQITVKVSNAKKSSSRSEQITVRSYVNPYVQILSPKNGAYVIQYSDVTIKARAQHNNGIHLVNFYVNDSLLARLSGGPNDEYNFTFPLAVSAGNAKLKVEAIANTTATIGKDSITVSVEGIILGKKNRHDTADKNR